MVKNQIKKQIKNQTKNQIKNWIKNQKKKSNKELNKKSNKESNKELNKETSDEDLTEIINPKKDEDTTDWYDKIKFKKILTTIDNKFIDYTNLFSPYDFHENDQIILYFKDGWD